MQHYVRDKGLTWNISMQVDLYALCWNDADMLPFFFRHYDPLVSRYFIFDDHSSDGSLDLMRAHPNVEVESFVRSDPASFTLSELSMSNGAPQG